MERAYVIVAFGDVAGFNPWIRRGSNAQEVIKDFVEAFYRELETFVATHADCHIKYLGDGFMVLMELKSKRTYNKAAANFISDTGKLAKRLQRIVKKCDFPAPEGFRIRIACGHVSKIQVRDPVDRTGRDGMIWEYIGYSVNLAQKLLDVAPNILLVLQESAVKILGRQKTPFRLRRFVGAKERPRGVDSEDIEGLWVGEL